MNKFRNAMEEVENTTLTENNSKAYKSSLNNCLDLFALGGSARNMDDIEKRNLIINAYNENSDLAMKLIFYIRDVRQGMGERDFFRYAIKVLSDRHSDSILKNIKYIPEYGRWDDLYTLVDYKTYKDTVFSFMKEQVEKDLTEIKNGTNDVSLIGKWLKSENASSNETKRLARMTMSAFNMKPKEYRKTLVKLRKAIDILETKLSKKEYDKIDYSKIPSRASMIYRSAFYRNDEDRYTSFLESVEKGEKTINTSNIYPYEFYNKVRYGYDKSLDVMWDNLPNYINEKNKNALVMADVSGSMDGDPMAVSVSMALYFAERCEGVFKDLFLTFSSNPEFVKIKGKTLYEKMNNLLEADGGEWSQSTDINKAFKLILDTGIKHDVPNEDMPKILYIVSDMQFDKAEEGRTNYDVIKEQYEEAGYEMPVIVFWNVDARNKQVPVTKDENGTVMVSGFSPKIFEMVVENTTPEEFMMNNVYHNERYKVIEA